MNNVLIVGSVFVDIICEGLSEYPNKGEELYIDSIVTSPGGSAITAVILKNLNMNVSLASAIGTDFFGAYLIDYLTQVGISDSLIHHEPTQETGVSICIPKNNDRSFISKKGPELARYLPRIFEKLTPLDIEKFRFLHVDFPQLQHPTIQQCISDRRDSLIITSDIGYEEALAWKADDFSTLKDVSWFFPNEQEARLITHEQDPAAMVHHLRRYVPHPVVTLGPKGAVTIDESEKIIQIPAPQVQAVNPSGSGDSFTAGLLYGLAHGFSIADTIRFANIVGAMSTEDLRSCSSDLTIEDVRKRFDLEKETEEATT